MQPAPDYFVLALHDRFCRGEHRGDHYIRLGSDLGLKRRLAVLEQTLATRFDAVVWHYVPTGFSSKGLPFWIGQTAPLLGRHSGKLVVILHEIWAGGEGKPLRLRVAGYLQKRILANWLGKLKKPLLVTTSAYTAQLITNEGLVAAWCPVFSNLGKTASAQGLPESVVAICNHTAIRKAIFFGSMPPDTCTGEIIRFLEKLAGEDGTKVQVWHLGLGQVDTLWLPLQEAAAANPAFAFERLGPLAAPAINYLMQKADWGLSTYPYQLWGKSGSMAAMRANGLPVMVMGSLAEMETAYLPTLPVGIFAWGHWKNSAGLPQIIPGPDLGSYNASIASQLHSLTGLGGQMVPAPPPISILITVYKCWPQAIRCISAIGQHTDFGMVSEILVVHDDPGTEVPEEVRQNPMVRVVQNERNLGYVSSVNLGMTRAASDWVFLLDADAFLQTPLQAAFALMQPHTGYRLIVPAARFSNGEAVRRLYPCPHPWSLLLGQKMEAGLEKRIRMPQVVAHSYAWLVHRPTFMELGGLDAKLHFLEADVDFCARLYHTMPGSLVYCHGVGVVHDGGANPITRNQRVLEWYRARWYIFRKDGRIKRKVLFKIMVRCRLVLEAMLASLLALQPGLKRKRWKEKRVSRIELLVGLKDWD